MQKLLHFPEEVALRLAESEYQLFYQVAPSEYLKHVAQDPETLKKHQVAIKRSSTSKLVTVCSSTQTEEIPPSPTDTAAASVQILVNRFNEVEIQIKKKCFFKTMFFNHFKG